MEKTVKVHEDTHRALKRLKTEGRRRSIDEVVRELVKAATGRPVEKVAEGGRSVALTSYASGTPATQKYAGTGAGRDDGEV